MSGDGAGDGFEREVLANVLDGVSLHDADGTYLFANPAFTTLTGWDPADLVGRSAYEFFHPDDLAAIQADHARTLELGDAAAKADSDLVAYRLRCKDGEYVWVETTSHSFGDASRIACVTRNTVRRVEASANTHPRRRIINVLDRLSANRSRSLASRLEVLLDEACAVLELEIGIAARIEGDEYAVRAVQAPRGMELTAGTIFETANTYCAVTVAESTPVAFEHAARQRDWATHPAYRAFGLECYIAARIVVNGRVFGTLNFSSRRPRGTRFSQLDRDLLTLMARWVGQEIELEQATSSLRRSEQLYRQLFEGSPVLLALMDWSPVQAWVDDGAPLDALDAVVASIETITENDACRRALGNIDRNALHRASFEAWREALLRKDPHELDHLTHSTTLRTPSGQSQHRLFRAMIPAHETNGGEVTPAHFDFSRVLITGTDISDIQAESIRRIEAERNERLEGLRLLAGGVAHDFNNRLLAIMGHAELVRLEVSDQPPLVADLDVVLEECRRASQLSQRMLSYSGEGLMSTSDDDLEALLRDSVSSISSGEGESAEVELRVDDPLPAVRFDARALGQAIDAVLQNATEAAEGARGRVDVGVGPSPMAGMAVRIRIADNGPGMSSEVRGRALDPFFSTKFAGRGLGLPMAMSIVHRHGGEFDIDSRPGEGTVVIIDLPPSEASTPHSRNASPSGITLIVDDEPQVLRVAERILRRRGHEVLTAADGEGGVAIALQERAQLRLVILDMSMPGLDGAGVLRRLRDAGLQIPIILTSGYAEREVQAQAIGHDGFLRKPWTPEELDEALARVEA